jgi:hypothetical protein
MALAAECHMSQHGTQADELRNFACAGIEQQSSTLMQRVLSSANAAPSGLDHHSLVNSSLQLGLHGQLQGRPLGQLSQAQSLAAIGSKGFIGSTPETESILKEAHEAYRKGDYMQALQLCHAVRPAATTFPLSQSTDHSGKVLNVWMPSSLLFQLPRRGWRYIFGEAPRAKPKCLF